MKLRNKRISCRVSLILIFGFMFIAIGDTVAGTPSGLVLWNKLGSQSEIQNSQIGLDGTFSGGSFVTGMFGNAYSANFDEDLKVTFPKEVITINAGTIEFWAKLTGFGYQLSQQPHYFFQIDDGNSMFRMGYTHRGRSNFVGGLTAEVGHGILAGTGLADDCIYPLPAEVEHGILAGTGWCWTYKEILGTGKVEDWHHYALVWNEDGIPGVADGTKKIAVFLDGQLNSGSWYDLYGSDSKLVPITNGELGLVLNHNRFLGNVAIDNLKIWNYAKTNFSDRSYEGDITPPTTTDDSPAGWQKEPFAVTLSCIDNSGGSGCKETKYRIDSGAWQTGNSISISIEGDHLIEYYSIDNANNEESPARTAHAKLDKTAPTIAITTPSDGTNYILNQLVAADYGCNDGNLSGISTCIGATANGDYIDTTSVGSKSFTVTSTDLAGNTASLSINYNVIYTFNGFSNPVNNIPTINTANAGQTIPLKWRLLDDNNVPITNLATVAVKVVSTTCSLGETPDQTEEYAAGSSGLQNKGDGYYQFNWKTPTTYARSCKTLNLNLGDGMLQKALFEFKK